MSQRLAEQRRVNILRRTICEAALRMINEIGPGQSASHAQMEVCEPFLLAIETEVPGDRFDQIVQKLASRVFHQFRPYLTQPPENSGEPVNDVN